MSGNPVDVGANFGAKYLKTGKFGKKGLTAIKGAGFADKQAFLDAAGVNINAANLAGTPQGFKSAFKNTLKQGYQAPTAQPTDGGAATTPGTSTTPPQGDPVQPQNPGVGQGLVQQGVDLSNTGADILNNGNPASNPLLNAGNNYTTGAQQDLGKVDALAGAARAQGANILNTLSQQQGAADQDIQNLFNAQPLDTLRSNLAQLNSASQASGRTNSRSGNEMNAQLQRGLVRDQAAARLGSNNQFRAQTVDELGNQRTTDLGLGNMFSNQGIQQGQLGLNSTQAGGNLINSTNELGANIFNQGFQNQLGALGFLNNTSMQNFNTQNQLLQKALANITGSRQNRQSLEAMRRQLELQQQAAQGPGFMSGMLSGGIGAGLGNVL